MDGRKVVVTGLGVVSPVGIGLAETWTSVVNGRSGVSKVEHFDASALPTQIAGTVRNFRAEDWMDPKEARRNDRFIQLAVAASNLAMEDAGLDMTREDPTRVGVIVGSGLGGLQTFEDMHQAFRERGHRKVSPFFVPSVLCNLAPAQISLRHGLQGPNFAPVAACATGNHALGEAMLMLERGMADVILAGSTEATVTPLGLAAFIAARALSERNDHPARASRPFDRARDGFVPAEGAGVLVLETFEHARKRGARIYAHLAGYGASADAHHVTAPPHSGEGAQRAMRMALSAAGLNPDELGYINAHATSTPSGDVAECEAIRGVFGERASQLPVSSTKSMTGHMLGGTGAVEAVVSVLALTRGVLPPTINVDELDPACGLDVVPNTAREVRVKSVMSNGFGFGGVNACIVFRALD